MSYKHLLLGVVFTLLSAVCSAQSGLNSRELHVHVSWADDDRVSLQQLRVELLNATQIYIDQAFTDDTGNARFSNVRPGDYRLRVTGVNAIETVTSVFNINPQDGYHSEFVRVKFKPANSDEAAAARSGQGSVSAAELNIPDKARQEFDKGNAALEKDQVEEAKKRYKHAADIYPAYAAAWNGLGVVAMRAGDENSGSEMFDRAIAADPQYAPAHVNRAKVLFGKPDYRGAEAELTKAVSLEPLDVAALSLLATAQLQNHEYEQALANARKVHTLPHVGMGGAHLVAGTALEALKRPAEALQEYKLYVAETPNGPNTQRARAKIDQMSQQIH